MFYIGNIWLQFLHKYWDIKKFSKVGDFPKNLESVNDIQLFNKIIWFIFVVSCETNELESSLTANSRRLLKVGQFQFSQVFFLLRNRNVLKWFIYI
jgi:hypothetical protein